jgi:hypothetical protein
VTTTSSELCRVYKLCELSSHDTEKPVGGDSRQPDIRDRPLGLPALRAIRQQPATKRQLAADRWQQAAAGPEAEVCRDELHGGKQTLTQVELAPRFTALAGDRASDVIIHTK